GDCVVRTYPLMDTGDELKKSSLESHPWKIRNVLSFAIRHQYPDGCRPNRMGQTDEVLMIRVLLVDDQSVVRRGLRLRFHLEPDLEVVGEASSGTEALTLAQTLTPDVVLMDIQMPDLDGIAATAALRRVVPQSAV